MTVDREASWHRHRMVALDLETTSADPEFARIVTWTVASVGGGETTKVITRLVDPGVDIPLSSTEIHGITTEQAQTDGIRAHEGIGRLLLALEYALQGGTRALVVFRAPYDLTVIDREARRHNLVQELTQIRARVVDPAVIDKHIERYRGGKRTLAATCEHYQAMLGRAHDSTNDAVAAARCAWAMANRGQVVRRVRDFWEEQEFRELVAEWEDVRYDVAKLHDAQVKWARYQAEGLEEFFHKGAVHKGVPPQPDRVVPREWPVIPPPELRGRAVEPAAA